MPFGKPWPATPHGPSLPADDIGSSPRLVIESLDPVINKRAELSPDSRVASPNRLIAAPFDARIRHDYGRGQHGTLPRSTGAYGAAQMETIQASQFKAKCLHIMDEVAGRPVVITKNGKPVATLTPYPQRRNTLLGLHRSKGHILGDIVGPVYAPWEASD